MRVVTANVNGIRAARRRGGIDRLAAEDADAVALQEVRATPAQLAAALADSPLAERHRAHVEAARSGHAGVAVLTREEPDAIRVGLDDDRFADSGRWIEVVLAGPIGPISLVSAYVPKGEVNTSRQEEKYAFLDAVSRRLDRALDGGEHLLLTGDLNIAHTRADLKNWKGNENKAGFLPQERAYLDRWVAAGFVDVHRWLAGEGPGPYTWWSWRGRAFDNDAGWRIDAHFATPALASGAVAARVDRAPSYAARWSDHAAVVVDYDLGADGGDRK